MGLYAMRRLRRFSITNKSDLIYAKIEISHYISDRHQKELYAFAVMELGSNILKHSQSNGEIWLLERQGLVALAVCDRGKGIGNIELACQKGYSTYEQSSLGIGLSALSAIDGYMFSIVSSTKKEIHGTVVFFGPNVPKDQTEWLSLSFDENYNGDFTLRKGRLFAFGDVAGHGLKASTTVAAITTFFERHCHSILMINDFFNSLHRYIIDTNLRCCDLVIGAVDAALVTFSGIGNISAWKLVDEKFYHYPLRSGSIGAHYSKPLTVEFDLTATSSLILTSDGVLKEKFNLLNTKMFIDEPVAALCATLYFCGSLSDDASIIHITHKGIV